jgi:hypothetical protein
LSPFDVPRLKSSSTQKEYKWRTLTFYPAVSDSWSNRWYT